MHPVMVLVAFAIAALVICALVLAALKVASALSHESWDDVPDDRCDDPATVPDLVAGTPQPPWVPAGGDRILRESDPVDVLLPAGGPCPVLATHLPPTHSMATGRRSSQYTRRAHGREGRGRRRGALPALQPVLVRDPLAVPVERVHHPVIQPEALRCAVIEEPAALPREPVTTGGSQRTATLERAGSSMK
jgi:hypothetical protein